MLFLSMIITAFAAILALSPSSFAEPIPVRNTQLAERDAIAERETIAVGQEIAKAQFLAEREAKPEIEALEGRQINVEQFCCQDVACTICDGTLCETRDCVWWDYPLCCAAAFKSKRDDDGSELFYNQRGELMQFVDPATFEPMPAPPTLDERTSTEVIEALPELAERQIFLEQKCCDGSCTYCNKNQDCDIFTCDFPFWSCCATAINGKRNEDGSAQVVNQRGEVVRFVDVPGAVGE